MYSSTRSFTISYNAYFSESTRRDSHTTDKKKRNMCEISGVVIRPQTPKRSCRAVRLSSYRRGGEIGSEGRAYIKSNKLGSRVTSRPPEPGLATSKRSRLLIFSDPLPQAEARLTFFALIALQYLRLL
ncbi:hypothetical protein EVAR_23733_1 [Eumeta japonica]|uniref:Uncharacterized protein n=1 Tax=Eumeta variegata TaxID=151549 RepID=A0A4C1VIG1_EUMVA|nr:hypothetical protein EVAR_23733_1 [Eumeta japonica]